MGFSSHFGEMGGWAWGVNQSLPRLHSSMLPTRNGLNRNRPGAPNRIQVDTLLRRIASPKLVPDVARSSIFPGSAVTSLFDSDCDSVQTASCFLGWGVFVTLAD